MKKIITALCVVLCLFAVGYNAYQSERRANSDKRNVYAVLPLTGFGSSIGQKQKITIDLWKEKNPNASFDIHIIDSESTPMKALTALKQALLNEQNPIVITSNSFVSYNSLPVIEEKNGFEFMICTFERDEFKNSHFLRMSDRNIDSMELVAKYLSQYKNVVLVYTNEEFGKSSIKGLNQLLQQYDVQPTKSIDIEPAQRDVRIEALKILKQEPDAVVMLGYTALGSVNLIKEMRIQGYKGNIIVGVGLADPVFISQLGPYLDGLIFPDKNMQLTKGPNVPVLKKIEQAMQGRPFAVPLEMWDTLDLIEWTIKNNKPFAQKTYADLGKWQGIAGDIEFLDDGNVVYKFHLATFKNGKILPLEESETK